jgi:PAS domain S-box-containing protein
LEKYQTIFEQAVEGIFQVTPSGRFLNANPALTRMLGYSSTNELMGAITDIGKQLFVRSAVHLRFQRKIEQDSRVKDFEAQFFHKSGRIIKVSLSAHVVLDSLGAPHYYDSTVEDITDRKSTETFLNSILQNLPMMVFIKDPKNLRFLMWNKHNEEVCGFSDTEMIGKSDHDFFPKEQADIFASRDREALASNAMVESEEEISTRDKGKRILRTRKVPVLDDNGEPLYLLGISEDITERKEAEAELAYERELLRSLLDRSPDYIYFKDINSRFIRASRTLGERFGLSPQDIIGKSDFDLFDGEHAREAFEDEQEIIHTGRPVVGKIENEVWKDGIESWALTNKMPLRNRAGEIIGTFGISKDITPIKDAEAKLKKAHQQLLETSRLAGMTEVATNVLHNVGNVLNSVNISCSVISDRIRQSKMGNLAKISTVLQEHANDLAEFLSRDPKGLVLPRYLSAIVATVADEQKEVLEELASLSSNIDHIKEIVAMQQSYAKVSGLLEELRVVDLVEDALRMNAGALERHQIRIVREYADVPLVLVDKHKVLQILINLIRNAKYALDERGHGDKVLTLRVGFNDNGKIEIVVTDNGVGIPAENLDRIFSHGFTTRKEGHGFGLHSGCLAAKEFGGSLKVHSAGTGQGATFTLELPGTPAPASSD